MSSLRFKNEESRITKEFHQSKSREKCGINSTRG